MLLFAGFPVSQTRLWVFGSWDRCSSGGSFTPHEQRPKWHRAEVCLQGRLGCWMDAWSLVQCSEGRVIWKAFRRWIDEGHTTKSKDQWTKWLIIDQTVEKGWKMGVLADREKKVSGPCLWKVGHASLLLPLFASSSATCCCPMRLCLATALMQ